MIKDDAPKNLDPEPWVDVYSFNAPVYGPRYSEWHPWTDFHPRLEYSQKIEDYP